MTQTFKLIAGLLFFLFFTAFQNQKNKHLSSDRAACRSSLLLSYQNACLYYFRHKNQPAEWDINNGLPCQIARSRLLDGDIYPCLPFYVTLLPPLLQTDISCNLHIYKRSCQVSINIGYFRHLNKG